MNNQSFVDSTRKLTEAIQELEAFSRQAAESDKISPVFKTISLMGSLFLQSLEIENSYYKSSKKKCRNQQDILRAVEIVNRERLLIQKLQKGNPAEQKLAESFTKVIAIYNKTLEKQTLTLSSYSNKIFKLFSKDCSELFYNLPKIDLPYQNNIEYHYPQPLFKNQNKTLSSVSQIASSSVSLSQQSVELFHMKALSLLERYGIATNPEARAIIKKSPIYSVIEEDNSTCTLSQRLILFPGQIIHVTGISALDPKNRTIRQFFPETFSISLESNQTGFPYPSQRTGWALTNALLHGCPQRIDLLSLTAKILDKKKSAAVHLAPNSLLINRAKSLIKIKKRVFGEHRIEFISLHKKLAYAIVKNASKRDFFDCIDPFFDAALNHSNPFDWLSEINQKLLESFICKPHQMTLNAILNGKSNDFSSKDPVVRYQMAKKLFSQILLDAEKEMETFEREALSTSEKEKFNYIKNLGKILGSASQTIILQYLSEDLMFLPPLLQPFEQKVQAAAYQHAEDFADELDMAFDGESACEQSRIYEILKKTLEWDIALFETKKDLKIPKELSRYFELRYFSLSSI